MPLTRFTFEPERREQFIRFGREHYAGDKRWILPFDDELRFQLSPEFVFHRTSGNEHCCFLAAANGRVLGRVLAARNAALHDSNGAPVGAIGFFESIDDPHVAADLLGAAQAWLQDRYGLTAFWGPMNFDIWHGYRLMTRGFEREPFYGEPRNKAYYPELFERCGWRVAAEWDSVEVEGREALQAMISRGADRYRYLCRRGYRFAHFDPANWADSVSRVHRAMTESFSGFWGATPLDVGEFSRLLQRARPTLRPEFCVLAYNETNTLAGFSMALIELGAAVWQMRGRNTLLGRMRFALQARHADTVNFYLGGVSPEEIERRSGLGRAGFYATINAVLAAGYQKLLLTLRLKGNAAHALAQRGAPPPQREYALFEVRV